MGYTTDFSGTLKLNRQLTVSEKNFLDKLASTRRMVRDVDPKYGVEGEFYIESVNDFGQDHEPNIVDYNRPPKTQPSLWLQWVPTEDGMGIEWDGSEKFYNYVEWLQYLIEKVFPYILRPGDEPLVLNGDIKWEGEDRDDFGMISVRNNIITIHEGRKVYHEQVAIVNINLEIPIPNNATQEEIDNIIMNYELHHGYVEDSFEFVKVVEK